jgi:hypothetical protein
MSLELRQKSSNDPRRPLRSAAGGPVVSGWTGGAPDVRAYRRAVSLNLTKAGERACSMIRAARGVSVDKALGVLRADERATLGILAEKILAALVREEDQAYAVCRLCDEAVCDACPVDVALSMTD